jgi:transposase
LSILDAILAGQRDPQQLAQLRDRRVKASADTIAKSLVGDYRAEHLFTLRQSLQAYRYYQQLIADCDQQIEQHLQAFNSRIDPLTLPPRKGSHKKPRGNEPAFDLRGHLYRILGVDLTQVPGIDALTVNTLLAEVGPDLSKFRSAPAFASWMALCPDNDKSGGKILSVRTRKVKNRAALALRRAAHTLHHSLLWDSSTNACGPSWAHPKPSPPQRINWLASFIIC